MRKYAFRVGDIVRERTAERHPVIGKVIGCGSSAEHDFYKISSRGEVYSARDDEIVLVRRAPNKYDNQGLLGQFLLDWYGPGEDPAEGEECLIVWRDLEGVPRLDAATWNGRKWEMEVGPDQKVGVTLDTLEAWAPWEWPETAKPEAGEEDDDDKAADPDD